MDYRDNRPPNRKGSILRADQGVNFRCRLTDITAHREIAHATTTLLPPDNVEAWEAAILSVARRHTIDIPPVPQHMTEAAFCHDILKFVEAVPPKGKGLSKLDGAPIKLEISA